MRVFVTGGAGFIGSHVVEALLAQGHDVTVFDNLSTGSLGNLERAKLMIGTGENPASLRYVHGDILNHDDLQRALPGHDAVSHHAAQLEIMRAYDDPITDLTVNTIGTLNVLRACVAAGVKRVIFPSSAAVYGQASGTEQRETHALEPHWSYGVSKLACEHYLRIFGADHGIKWTALRYAIVYGQREWFGRVLTVFLSRLLRGVPPVVFGDGSQVRDFVHVSDVVRLHNACLTSSAAEGMVFNASSGVGTTIRDLAELVIDVSGERVLPVFEDVQEGARSERVPGRIRIPSELQTLIQPHAKATALLDWAPCVPLRDGIARQWAWLRENPSAYSGVMRV